MPAALLAAIALAYAGAALLVAMHAQDRARARIQLEQTIAGRTGRFAPYERLLRRERAMVWVRHVAVFGPPLALAALEVLR